MGGDLSREPSLPRVRVKICGLTRREDAVMAAREGADYLGVVLVPGSPRALDPYQARGVVEGLGLPAVAVVADLDVRQAAEAARAAGASVLQLHGGEPPEVLRALREEGPWKVWKALRIRGKDHFLEGLARYGEAVDGLLLDGWHPRRLGGTGTAFPWREVGELRERFPPGLSLIAAGGLTPDNVGEALLRLRPEVVDVSSGVERHPGVKDPQRLRAFMEAVRPNPPAAGGRGS